MAQETSLPGANALHEDLKRAISGGHFGWFVLFDVDEFQQINATEGRQMGDRILSLIRDFVSENGWKGYRIGGDEFGLIVNRDVAFSDGEDLRVGVSLQIREKLGLQATISGGGIRRPEADLELDSRMESTLFSTTRQLLIHAKKQGRNRIAWLPSEPVDSIDVMKIMVHFYQDLARANAARAREHVALAEEMKVESRTDFMTGLYNRRGFEDIFQRLALASRRNNNPIALIYLDSDTLKEINDTKGHDAGDRFIIDISRVLSDVVRGSDFVFRWAGDEFAVVMDHATQEKALALAGRIHQAIIDRTEGTVSLGVYCGVPENVETAVKRADEAMYRVKQRGKNGIEIAV